MGTAGATSENTEQKTGLDPEMRQTRIELLRKELIGPKVDEMN